MLVFWPGFVCPLIHLIPMIAQFFFPFWGVFGSSKAICSGRSILHERNFTFPVVTASENQEFHIIYSWLICQVAKVSWLEAEFQYMKNSDVTIEDHTWGIYFFSWGRERLWTSTSEHQVIRVGMSSYKAFTKYYDKETCTHFNSNVSGTYQAVVGNLL